jgi:hypothetical protein
MVADAAAIAEIESAGNCDGWKWTKALPSASHAGGRALPQALEETVVRNLRLAGRVPGEVTG